MRDEPIMDFPTLQRRYGGQYVALQYEIVVAHGKTFLETRRAVEKMRLRDVHYQFVQPKPEPQSKRRAS